MHPYATLGGGRQPTVTLYHGEVLDVLASMEAGSVHCTVTSPPYWGLRDYGTATWSEGDPSCDHRKRPPPFSEKALAKSTIGAHANTNHTSEPYTGSCWRCGAIRQDHALGSESTLDCLGWATKQPCSACYVCRLVQVGRELWRVLRDDGTFWLNLGSAYSDKQEQGVPWRVALALQADGWTLRSEVIWHKRNPLPESVQDRPTKAHEQIFLLTKQARYFYDAEAVKVPATAIRGLACYAPGRAEAMGRRPSGNETASARAAVMRKTRANLRSVWSLASEPTPFAHFATYPTKLVEPCILAGSPTQMCSACGAGWRRVVEREDRITARRRESCDYPGAPRTMGKVPGSNTRGCPTYHDVTTGFAPTCPCDAPSTHATVLDPFVGSGTTALVAVQHGRHAIGIDLNRAYLDLASTRLTPALAQLPLFTTGATR